MNYNKYTPFIVFFIFVAGLFIGRYAFRPDGSDLTFSFFNGQVSKLQSVVNIIDKKYVDEVSIDNITENIIPQLLKYLDPHTTYIPINKREESEQHLAGHFRGFGFEYSVFKDTAIILNVSQDSPADNIGIIPGDKIININDNICAGFKGVKDTISENLKFENDTLIKIGVKRFGIDSIIHFELVKKDIPIFSVNSGYMIDSTIGYINISSFASNTYDELISKVDSLKLLGMNNLIIDLRGNGGGYVKTSTSIANEFLPENSLITYTKNRDGISKEYKANGEGKYLDINTAILIDSYTASASEMLSGAFQDNDKGIVIGRRSFGKGLVQEPIELSDGSVIRLTTARYYTPTGRCIQKPYEEYKNDIKNRIANGELDSANAISFPDSLKFTTPNGKIVYGGGGIIPDIFVPENPDNLSGIIYNLEKNNIIAKYSAEKYNQFYNDTISTEQIIEKIFNQKNYYDNFIKYIQEYGVKIDKNDAEIYQNKINNKIRTYIYAIAGDINKSYSIKNELDNDVLKAVEYFNNDTINNKIINKE